MSSSFRKNLSIWFVCHRKWNIFLQCNGLFLSGHNWKDYIKNYQWSWPKFDLLPYCIKTAILHKLCSCLLSMLQIADQPQHLMNVILKYFNSEWNMAHIFFPRLLFKILTLTILIGNIAIYKARKCAGNRSYQIVCSG